MCQGMNRDELGEAVMAAYPNKPPSTQGLYRNMIWAFYHEIEPGDFIVARKGRKTLAAVGQVNESACYAPGMCPIHGPPQIS